MSPGEYFLVTGGSGGIGAATCVALAGAGFRPLVAFHHNEQGAREIALRCGGASVALDLGCDRSIDSVLEWLAHADTELAGVVNAASPPPEIVSFGKIRPEELVQQWRINVEGPRRLIAGLVRRRLGKRKKGTIVGVLSAAMGNERGVAMRNMGSYLIAKYGQSGLLAVLATEYPWLKIRSVRPGYTETRMLAAFDERFIGMQREREPFNTPEDVAAMIIDQILSP